MGFLDTILGRTKTAQPNLDELFSLPTAAVTLEAGMDLVPTGTGSVCFRAVEGKAFGDIEKDVRVRAYANAYRSLRGESFVRVERNHLSFRGRMPSEFATGTRQRTLMPMHLGITGQVRPGRLSAQFDDGAQSYLMSVYAECGLRHDVRWLGLPTGVAPADLVSLQEIIHQVRPDAIISVGTERGLVGFVDSTAHAGPWAGT